MKIRSKRAWALAAMLVAGAVVATVASAGDGKEGAEKHEMKVVVMAGAGERVEIDDLGELAVGESRSYPTESGKTAIVTRKEDGYELDLDGKTIRIGHELDAAHAHHAMRMKRIELDGDGEAKSFVIADGPEREVMIFHGGPGAHGEHAGHGFRFEQGAPPPHHLADGLVARLEKNEKFRSLDDATRALVLEAIRESAPELHWIGIADGDDEPAGDGRVKVFVRETVTKEEDGE